VPLAHAIIMQIRIDTSTGIFGTVFGCWRCLRTPRFPSPLAYGPGLPIVHRLSVGVGYCGCWVYHVLEVSTVVVIIVPSANAPRRGAASCTSTLPVLFVAVVASLRCRFRHPCCFDQLLHHCWAVTELGAATAALEGLVPYLFYVSYNSFVFTC